jgi:hypothetical protein
MSHSIPPRGTTPSSQEKRDLKSEHPNLKNGEWKKTGEIDNDYNCHSWSVLCEANLDWIDILGKSYDRLDNMFVKKGYKLCTKSSDYKPECKKRKIAIFCLNGEVTHSAKETDDGGWWESKMGWYIRIIHKLDQLEDSMYGNVCRCYYKTDKNANLDLCRGANEDKRNKTEKEGKK